MAFKRITMQDIADACNLSRNTVSKIFNNRGAVPEATRQMVLKKAEEMGYLSATVVTKEPAADSSAAKNIAVLSSSNPLNHNFGSVFIKSFTDVVCREGYTVQLYELSAEEISTHTLPTTISLANCAGVLCIELFDESFIRFISRLKIPMICVDSYYDINQSQLPCDIISMENRSSTMAITRRLIKKGAKTLGFVGDIKHCNSFHERWQGFHAALSEAGISFNMDICILYKDSVDYSFLDWTVSQLKKMPFIPDAFVCSNDYHAIKIIQGLYKLGISVPDDVQVTGFDNSPEAEIIIPNLTTINIPGTEIGVITADILLNRMSNPTRPYTLTYVQTKPIYRESTKN